MTRSPRFYLILGVLVYVLNFLVVAKADALLPDWWFLPGIGLFDWMR